VCVVCAVRAVVVRVPCEWEALYAKTIGAGIDARVENGDDDTAAVVLGVLAHELGGLGLFLGHHVPRGELLLLLLRRALLFHSLCAATRYCGNNKQLK
jgi:hypothetical protein